MFVNCRNLAGALALIAASVVQVQAEDVKLKLAGILPAEHFGTAIVGEMVKEIESAGTGITIQYFPSGQLGSGEELLDDAKFGNVDMVHANIYAQADQRLEFMSLPFLFSTAEELRSAFLNPNSTHYSIIREILADHGLKLLAPVGEGMIGMVAGKMPTNAQGLGDKGMNIRVWSSQLVKTSMEVLGYRTTTMSWAEVFPALQAGTVDGAICCTPEWAYNTFAASDVGAGFIPYNAFLEYSAIYMNAAKWNSLTPEQQAVVQAAATKAATEIANKAWERSDGFVQKMRDKGYEIVEFSQEERDVIKSAVTEAVWPTVSDVIGQDLLDRLLANDG
jgi:TRAP-type C4-dicarboxylate transport system substrate-binding protein|tara:strand:+ start:15 stop:1016 length:1002 start_codon:yes stop_codon:yes gene_type:complete